MTKESVAVPNVPDPTMEVPFHEEFLFRHAKLASRKLSRVLREGLLMSRQTLDMVL